MKKVLLVAFHFPPYLGSSGLLRAVKFCAHLPHYGWEPVVLTARKSAYEFLGNSRSPQVPPDLHVIRAFALDTQRHLAFRGRYPRWLALPDRWASWCLGAVPAGWRAIRKHNIDAILTTYPIATSILIGWILHRLSGKPWLVDLRDSMTEDGYPRDPRTRRVYRWLEEQAVRHSSRLLFTAPSAVRMYLQRYPWLPPEKCLLIPNGFDEEDFADLMPSAPRENRAIRLLHAGLLYPKERDPGPFFRTLARLLREARVDPRRHRVELRASGYEALYQRMIRTLGIEEFVHLLPPLPYREALQEGVNADGLLLFQAACCDHQIPAKAYEYLRLRKPILALTSETGDTAALLREAGGATLVDLADEDAIYRVLPLFLEQLQNGSHPLPDPAKVASYGRKQQAQRLAYCLSEVAGKGKGPGGAETLGSDRPD